jgi:hypothetical protein
VQRSGSVAIHPEVLAVLEPGLSVRLELFADVETTVTIERVRTTPVQLVVSGSTDDDPPGTFIMVQRGSAMSAELNLPLTGRFRVRGTAETGYAAHQMEDPAVECATGPRQTIAAEGGGVAGGGVAGACDDGTVVDLIVYYTPIARQQAGGPAAIETDIAMSVEATNQAYIDSEIDVQVNLLLVQEIAYGENGGYADHLYRLTNGSDGIMDEVHLMRNELGADLVSLYVDDGQYCGIAWLMNNVSPAFAGNGFSIVTWYCSSLVLAHELGHNMGCHHDHDNASSSPAYNYSYGHRWNGDSGALWRTIMSYSPGVRIGRFSNPGLLFDGQPTGVPNGETDPADNALTINQTRSVVANFRCSSPPEGVTVVTDRNAFTDMLAQSATITFEGVPFGLVYQRPAGYVWSGLAAGVPMLQADSQANVAGGPFLSDYVASISPDDAVVFDLPEGRDAIGGLWFHGEVPQAGFDGLFRITLADGTVSNYLHADIATGQGMSEPGFIGFVSECQSITRVEYLAVTPASSTTAMADDVIYGSTGYGCPDNDDCADAVIVADGSTGFTTVNASTDGLNDSLCGSVGENAIESDVWFRYIADCDEPVTVSLCDVGFDARIAVYENFCPTLINQAIACATDGCGDGASVTFDSVAGNFYRIRVGSSDGSEGDGTLVITTDECIPAPYNDDCGDPATIGAGAFPFTTLGATTDGPAEDGCGYDGAPQVQNDVWFRFLAPCDETVTIELCDTDFEPRMALYTGPCPDGPGEIVDCSAGACAAGSRISIDAVAGTLYRVRIGSADGATGTGTITVTCGDPPPSCPADVDGNGDVDVDDLVAVILAWESGDPAADLNEDGLVDVDDLVEVILGWGPCS